MTLLQVHYLCPECRTAAQAALFLFPFALLTLVVARRPWWIVAVVFVTMAVGVNARTAFSLFFPPIIGEFGWDRGVTAGAFSFGFVVSGIVSPLIGRTMDRFGPRAVMELGVALMVGGLLLAPLTTHSAARRDT